MKLALIVIGSRPPALVRQAASELADYARRLFGSKPRIAARARTIAGVTLLLDGRARGLGPQTYALRPTGRRTFRIEAGSPIACLWAVYHLAERWGVRYQLHGDILPDRPGPMTLPESDVVCAPDMALRCFRTYNDFANNECCWAAEDYRTLLDQLVKMRFNAILICVRPADPMVDMRFHGARQSTGACNFGWKPPIRPHHPGHDLFVASGDAARGVFANPELHGHDSFPEAAAAGRSYMRKVFRMAHARGMKCLVLASAAEFAPAIRRKLLDRTRPRHKTKPAPITRIRYGIYQEGPDVETGRCMSVGNPVFLDAMAANMQAHVDAFPDADAFFFSSTEFGGSGADFQRAWRALDRKYALSGIRSLEAVEAEARRHAEGTPDRALLELRSDIVILYALDKLIHERGLDLSRSRRGAIVSPAGLAPELHRFLPRILPHGAPFFASYGYMPGHVATRTDTLRQEDPEAVRFMLTVSAEDDNIGMLPQMTGPAVHRIFEALRRAGAAGFLTRQWQHSNLLPTFHYMAHAAWEKGWTPERAYRHLHESVCGPRAAGHAVRACRRLERITTELHRKGFLVSFPVPNWITGFWRNWPKSHEPAALERIARACERTSDDLVKATRASLPAGRDMLVALERHTRHGVHYCRALAELGRARAAEDIAEQIMGNDRKTFVADGWPGGRFDRLDAARTAVATHTRNAEALMRQACATFAEGVRDRNDLGALATLNAYSLDVVSAIAQVALADGGMYSCIDR